jgi:hypothetical protein
MVHLPDEIWFQLTEYFKPPTDLCTRKFEECEHDEVVQQTILSLCLVSKQLRAISQSRLYCSFIKYHRLCARDRLLTINSEWLHKYYQRDERSFRTNCKATRLERFIRTLIHRLDLAAMVRQLRVGWFS